MLYQGPLGNDRSESESEYDEDEAVEILAAFLYQKRQEEMVVENTFNSYTNSINVIEAKVKKLPRHYHYVYEIPHCDAYKRGENFAEMYISHFFGSAQENFIKQVKSQKEVWEFNEGAINKYNEIFGTQLSISQKCAYKV